MSHDGPQRDHTASSRRRPRSVPDPDPAPTIMRARQDLGITALKSECHRDSSKSISAKAPQRDTHSVRNFVWFVACSSSRRRLGSIPDLAPNLMRTSQRDTHLVRTVVSPLAYSSSRRRPGAIPDLAPTMVRVEQDRGITTLKSKAPKARGGVSASPCSDNYR